MSGWEEVGDGFVVEEVEVAGGAAGDDSVLGRSVREYRFGSGARVVRLSVGPYFCGVCGRPVGRFDVVRCSRCGRLVCRRCVVVRARLAVCERCLRLEFDLDRADYYLLLSVKAGVDEPRAIFRATGIPPREARERLRRLLGLGLLTRDRASLLELIFRRTRLTERGLSALAAYEQVYGGDADSELVKLRIGAEAVKGASGRLGVWG